MISHLVWRGVVTRPRSAPPAPWHRESVLDRNLDAAVGLSAERFFLRPRLLDVRVALCEAYCPHMRQATTPARESSSEAYWTCCAVTAASATVSFGYSAAAVLGSGFSDTYAMYAAARSTAILAAVVTSSVARRRDALLVLAYAMSGIQALDALVGARLGDPVKTAGPAVTAIAGVTAAARLQRRLPSRTPVPA